MSQETGQTFDKTPRSADDPALVEQVLGPQEADEMRFLVDGRDSTSVSDRSGVGLELTSNEAKAIAEEEEAPERMNEKYVAWAKEFGKSKEWVDAMFIFKEGGVVATKNFLNLRRLDVKEFPPNLIEINGSLHLENTQITSFKNAPESVDGHLILATNADESLSRITSLEGCPRRISGDLWLYGVPVNSIPAGIELGGEVHLNKTQTELIVDCEAKGYSVVAK